MGSCAQCEDTPAVRGMINYVKHLVNFGQPGESRPQMTLSEEREERARDDNLHAKHERERITGRNQTAESKDGATYSARSSNKTQRLEPLHKNESSSPRVSRRTFEVVQLDADPLALMRQVDDMIPIDQESGERQFIADISQFLNLYGPHYFFKEHPDSAAANWSRLVAMRMVAYLGSGNLEVRRVSAQVLDWLSTFEPAMGNCANETVEHRIGKFLGELGYDFLYRPEIVLINGAARVSAKIDSVLKQVLHADSTIDLRGPPHGAHAVVYLTGSEIDPSQRYLINRHIEDTRATVEGAKTLQPSYLRDARLMFMLDGICLDQRIIEVHDDCVLFEAAA